MQKINRGAAIVDLGAFGCIALLIILGNMVAQLSRPGRLCFGSPPCQFFFLVKNSDWNDLEAYPTLSSIALCRIFFRPRFFCSLTRVSTDEILKSQSVRVTLFFRGRGSELVLDKIIAVT